VFLLGLDSGFGLLFVFYSFEELSGEAKESFLATSFLEVGFFVKSVDF